MNVARRVAPGHAGRPLLLLGYWKLIVAAFVAALAVLALPSAALATGSYNDTTGDGNGAPDLQKVTVASDATGKIVITITVDNWPSPPADVRAAVLLDTDMNTATGAPDTYGADYLFIEDQSDDTYSFAHWGGSQWVDEAGPTVDVSTDETGVEIDVNRSDLGNTQAFNYWVRTNAGDNWDEQIDDAPNSGAWNYTLAAGGPDFRLALMTYTPPRAGKIFSLKVLGLTVAGRIQDPIVNAYPGPDRYSCTASIAGKQLKRLQGAACRFTIPTNAKRKTLVVKTRVTYQGATKTFVYRLPIS
jgi:hypothetical protein